MPGGLKEADPLVSMGKGADKMPLLPAGNPIPLGFNVPEFSREPDNNPYAIQASYNPHYKQIEDTVTSETNYAVEGENDSEEREGVDEESKDVEGGTAARCCGRTIKIIVAVLLFVIHAVVYLVIKLSGPVEREILRTIAKSVHKKHDSPTYWQE